MKTASMTTPRSAAATTTRAANAGRALTLTALTALLGACASVPPAPPPTLQVPQAFVQAAGTAQEPVSEFWRGFGDADLDTLMTRALQANGDIRLAAARLREARAVATSTDAQAVPSVALTSGAARVRARNTAGVAETNNQFSVGLDMAWEADLFGRVSSERQAAAADVAASQALARAAQVSVAAEVARQYFELRGLQEQLRVSQLSLDAQREALKRVELREQVGRGTALDTERARALVQATEANLPALEASLVRARYRLAVLGGQPPSALDGLLAEAKPLPGLPPTALSAIGSPQTLLARRPDVAAAQAQWQAATARIGAAEAARWPSITLGGTLGLNAGTVGALSDSAAFAYNLGASLVWSLFDAGSRRAQQDAATARGEQAAITYEQTVLTALEETEGALSSYTRAQAQTVSLFESARSSSRAAEIARARFDVGVSDFVTVLDAERDLLDARFRLAQSQTAAATSLVTVYKALAGGWRLEQPQ